MRTLEDLNREYEDWYRSKNYNEYARLSLHPFWEGYEDGEIPTLEQHLSVAMQKLAVVT